MGEHPVRVTRRASELGESEVASRPPEPRLGPFVHAYYGYSERTIGPVRRREGPVPGMVLIIGLGPPIAFLDPGDETRTPQWRTSFLGGAHDSYVVTETAGAQAGIQVNFTPLGAYALAQLPMHTLTNRVVELEDVLGREAGRLAERLDAAPDWAARLDLVETFIAARLSRARPPSREVAWAWRRLRETHGRVRVSELAAELGRSRKHLVAQFREQVGLPPKTMARLVRFNRVVELLEHANGRSWGELAYACGYYDQAHLIKDFRQFAGVTPTQFVAERLSNVD